MTRLCSMSDLAIEVHNLQHEKDERLTLEERLARAHPHALRRFFDAAELAVAKPSKRNRRRAVARLRKLERIEHELEALPDRRFRQAVAKVERAVRRFSVTAEEATRAFQRFRGMTGRDFRAMYETEWPPR